MRIRLELLTQNEPGVVKHLLATIRNLFKLVDWSEDDRFRALLVADEVIQNAIDSDEKLCHGKGREVRVTIILHNTGMFLTVANDTEDFMSHKEVWTRRDILQECAPDLLGERGRGLSIVAQYSDRLTIRRVSEGQVVTKATIRCKVAERGVLR